MGVLLHCLHCLLHQATPLFVICIMHPQQPHTLLLAGCIKPPVPLVLLLRRLIMHCAIEMLLSIRLYCYVVLRKPQVKRF
jgi:hypothetical protein